MPFCLSFCLLLLAGHRPCLLAVVKSKGCLSFCLCLLPLRCLLPLCLGRTFSLPAKVKVAQPLLGGLIIYGLPAGALRAKVPLPFAFWALCPVAKSKG